jgi:hypothetical protein
MRIPCSTNAWRRPDDRGEFLGQNALSTLSMLWVQGETMAPARSLFPISPLSPRISAKTGSSDEAQI